jgi:hypothetical protein
VQLSSLIAEVELYVDGVILTDEEVQAHPCVQGNIDQHTGTLSQSGYWAAGAVGAQKKA